MERKESSNEDGAGATAGAAESDQGADQSQVCQECPVREWAEALGELEGTMRGLLPAEFWQHRRAAHREALLAVRSLLDAAIERADREPPARKSRAPKKITVE